MASLTDNKRRWDGTHNWAHRGDEWSISWGGTSMLWYGTLLPRIHAHVPVNSILEIACGYGRWTQYMKDLCRKLITVDLSQECIQACQRRFQDCNHIEYHINDGMSLSMVPDSSVDLVFSFDSLVHADELVIRSYISEFRRILTKNGIAFIHHSNLGEYHNVSRSLHKIPKLSDLLRRIGVTGLSALIKNEGWRDPSVDAKKVAKFAEQNGLRCISQEIIPWSMRRDRDPFLMNFIMIDCISIIGKDNSSNKEKNKVMRNIKFNEEVVNLSRLSKIYT